MNHKKAAAPRTLSHQNLQKEPNYMVQVADAKTLRKELLESLREAIIFMQGYDKFRSLQEDKVMIFHKLKMQTQEIQGLINNKMRKYLPRGKLKSIVPKMPKEHPLEERPIQRMPMMEEEEVKETPERRAQDELDELEAQLRQIEGQLQGIGK